MLKAEICPDGWIRDPIHNSKLGRISADGIMLWNGKREICVDMNTLQRLVDKHK